MTYNDRQQMQKWNEGCTPFAAEMRPQCAPLRHENADSEEAREAELPGLCNKTSTIAIQNPPNHSQN